MSTPSTGAHTLAGLVTKRAEISGRIEGIQIELRELMIALDALDATIRLFDPNYQVENIRPKPLPPVHKAFRGDLIRMVLSMLREAKGPLSTKQITLHVMAERGVDTADKSAFDLFRKRVGSMLRHHRANGLIRSVPGDDGQFMLWELVP
jgi:hypothetical protein